MFKSQQYSLINYDCLPFQIQNYILKCDPFTKNVVTLKLAFSSHQQGPPLWLVFNKKKSHLTFPQELWALQQSFSGIMDSFVYHM